MSTNIILTSAILALGIAEGQAMQMSDKPEVQTRCDGVPVTRFGFCWVFDAPPTLVEDQSLQVGNDAPREKLTLKHSRDIRSNLIGANTSRMPRTGAFEELPLEAVHLIDGDPSTCWMSALQVRADVYPVWVRLDFPAEQSVDRLVLRKVPVSRHPQYAKRKIGRGIPRRMRVETSTDGYTWEAAFNGDTPDAPDKESFEIAFTPRRVRQVRLTSETLDFLGEKYFYAFTFAELEVYNSNGVNVALVSRGTGVTVQSTYHSHSPVAAEQRWYWPLHGNLGLKWARVGYHDDPINWHWVEREKGVMKIDPLADAAVSELASNGVEVVMCLGYGNRLYSGPDGREYPQLWEWTDDPPKPPTTPEALAAWTRYVAFMVSHFKDRVRYFEIWNEWGNTHYWGDRPNLAQYLDVARAAIPEIRRLAPDAKIVMGSIAGFPHGISRWSADKLAEQADASMLFSGIKALATEVDVFNWHPYYQRDPSHIGSYPEDVKAFQRWLRSVGFTGPSMSTEWNYSALHPGIDEKDAKSAWCGTFAASEMEKAFYVLQSYLTHAGLDIPSFFCEMYNPYYAFIELSLLRRAQSADPVTPLQPSASYFATRNLATLMDGLVPADFACDIAPKPDRLQTYAFTAPGGHALAMWIGGRAGENDARSAVDVRIPSPCRFARVQDPVNGTQQPLILTQEDGATTIKGLLVGHAPILVRLEQ